MLLSSAVATSSGSGAVTEVAEDSDEGGVMFPGPVTDAGGGSLTMIAGEMPSRVKGVAVRHPSSSY